MNSRFESGLLRRSVAAAAIVVAACVVSGCASVDPRSRPGSFVDDATVTSRIRSDMAGDRNVDMSAVQVETQDGIVVLSGFAKNGLEKMTAESIAMKVNGARQIRNEIAVRP